MNNIKDSTTNDKMDTRGIAGDFYNYVLLKNEKLASAIYLVTDFLSDNEPLKWKLRKQALDLVTSARPLIKDRKEFLGTIGLERIISGIDDVVAVLDIARLGETVSNMNLEILREEYQKLSTQLSERMTGSSLKNYVSEQSLPNYSKPELLGSISTQKTDEPLFKVEEKLSSFSRQSQVKPVQKTENFAVEKNKGQKDTANDLYGLNNKDEKKSLRKEQIINFLRGKSWTNITDIAGVLKDCGAKTVQRELLDMVSRGILKKQGERRWSRYMLSDK